MNIVLIGPQGSGKGTQGELLRKNFKLFHFEVGGFLRKLAKKEKRLDEIINKKGELLPDEEVFKYTVEYLGQKVPERDGILFDGFPRSIKQYTLLKKWLSEKGKKINYAVFLDVSEEISIKRLSSRRICLKCGKIYNLITNPPPKNEQCVCGGKLIQRKDDSPDAIKKRLELYRKNTEPLLKILKKDGILLRVNAEEKIDKIFQDILKRIKSVNESHG